MNTFESADNTWRIQNCLISGIIDFISFCSSSWVLNRALTGHEMKLPKSVETVNLSYVNIGVKISCLFWKQNDYKNLPLRYSLQESLDFTYLWSRKHLENTSSAGVWLHFISKVTEAENQAGFGEESLHACFVYQSIHTMRV